MVMMIRKRTFRRFLPVACCFILLKVYMVREGGGVYPDEGQGRRSQLAEVFLQDTGRRPPEEGEVLGQATRAHSIHSQSSEGGLGGAPSSPASVEHPTHGRLSEAPSSLASIEHEALGLPLRYRSRESDLLIKDLELSDGGRNTSDAAHEERVVKAGPGWWRPVWLRITDDLYTYSAFWDSRAGVEGGPVVRVVGLWRYRQELVQGTGYQWTGLVKDNMLNCSCLLWYKDQEEPEEGTLKAFIFEEGLKVFVGTFFLCHPRAPGPGGSEGNSSSSSGWSGAQGGSQQLVPYAVSVVPKDTVSATYKLIYLSNRERSNGASVNRNLTSGVCVRPLHGPYGDLGAMTQFIAYYHTVLGVSHFYFYDLAVSVKVKELLLLFSAADGEVVVHLLPWNLPTAQWQKLWDLGSLAALNDCVYRSSGRHRYVAIVDLDEFIVPRVPAAGLAHLYHTVLKNKNGQEGDAALILNAFFCYDFKDNVDADDDTFPIFRFKRREARLWPPKLRSKIIINPEHIVAVGHHMVHNFLLNTSKNHGSPKHVSILHHYRACVDLRLGIHGRGSLVLEQETMTDVAMMKYKKTVLSSKVVKHYRNYLEGEQQARKP